MNTAKSDMTELLQWVSQGDRQAWAQFYERFKREVIGVLVLEGGRGRIVRVESVGSEIKSGSPVSVLAEGFGKLSVSAQEKIESLRDVAAQREERVALELTPKEHMELVYLAVSASGDIFVGGQLNGEAVVYKIRRKSFKWWKFYCRYRC